MIYKDAFNTPTCAWVRGACTPSKKSGLLRITPQAAENNVTLSGMAVNPQCFNEFEVSLKFNFTAGEGGCALFGFGKPFEWSGVKESPLQIQVNADGRGMLFGLNDITPLHFWLSADSAGIFELKIKKTVEQIQVGGSTSNVCMKKEIDTSGFFSIMVEAATFQLHEFVIESPIDLPPITSEERTRDILAWKRWRMDRNHETMAEIRKYTEACCYSGTWGYKADISITPGLVNEGEKVKVVFHYRSEPLESFTTIEPDYLGADCGARRNIYLEWHLNNQGVYEASVEISADIPGNWRITWDINGERLTRIFGVVAKGYTICNLWVGSNVPDIDTEIHKFDLPGDYWIGDWWSPFDKTPEAVLNYIRKYADFRHCYGDVLVPFVNAGWILPGIPDFNLFEVEADLQLEGFNLISEFMDTLDIGPLELIGSYTMGHATTSAAAKAGIKGLTSMCVWQNWLDGNDENCWKINHWGMPIVPYYMADDDFRKVADGQGTVGFNMGTGTSVRNYSIFCFEGCPTNTAPMQRYTNEGAVAAGIHRFYYAVDAWLHDAKNNAQPLFVTVALENFGNREEWQNANELAVEYLVKNAKSNKVVFASAASIAEYYHANYTVQPEHVFYQPDVYCGLRPDVKPAALPDRIECSNGIFHSLHIEGQALPQILWDYTKPWNNPVWDEMAELRVANGLITPDSISGKFTVPRNVDLNGIDVEITHQKFQNTVEFKISIDLRESIRALPLALWHLPLSPENLKMECGFSNVRWLSVVDGFTGNLNGLVVCENLPMGRSVIKVKFTCSSHYLI